LTLKLEGETGRRMDAIVRNWLLTVPDVNPGIFEMMRLRDRNPAYEHPLDWSGEFLGKYLTSCVLARRMTDDPELDRIIRETVRELGEVQAEDGYLGPFPKEERLMGHWDLWGHYHAMLGLYLWYHDVGDRDALAIAARMADLMCNKFLNSGRRAPESGAFLMNMAIMHMLGILHRETGEDRYFELMQDLTRDWDQVYYTPASRGIEFFQSVYPRWESLHTMLGLSEFYRITGKESYRDALLHWWNSIHRTDIHNSGSFSTGEQAVGNPFKPGAIETCCTVAWVAYSVESLHLSRDSRIADALELTTWNAVLAHQHPSGRWCTYDTPMDGKRNASAHSIVFQARPGTPELNCCSVNGPRGLGMLSEWALVGDNSGLYLNYYGPGQIEAKLSDGSKWTVTQETDYPAEGNIRIEVKSSSRAKAPFYLRIPAWSGETMVSVNGKAVSGVVPGRYLRLDRKWKRKTVIEIEMEMSLRALRGDRHVDFKTSIYRGPLLLAYDQKHNTTEPGELPSLDWDNLQLTSITTGARFQPIVLFKVNTLDDRGLILTDFATAGAHGTEYRSWLPVVNAPPSSFRIVLPGDSEHVAADDVRFRWSAAADNVAYDLTVSRNRDLSDPVVFQKGIKKESYLLSSSLKSGERYFWQVTARSGRSSLASENGPWSFVADDDVTTLIVDAPFEGSVAPGAGMLLHSANVKPAAGPSGKTNDAVYFNGENSKVVYDATNFPLSQFSFSAWFRPEGMLREDVSWHQVASAWCYPSDDPLRIGILTKKLVVQIEQKGSHYSLPALDIENDKWVHIVLVKELDELRLYLGGKKVATRTVPLSFFSGTARLGIGCNPLFPGIESFRGAIADVLFTRDAVSEEEIAVLFEEGQPKPEEDEK